MALGFTVEDLVPVGRGAGALRMGLTRVGADEWLWPDADLAARGAVFDAHPDAIAVLPGAEAAAAEAAELVGGQPTLGAAARAVWEDLCVMQADADGAYRLTAGALGFPTDWSLAEKLGHPMAVIHAPIHGYAEQLAAGVDHFFAGLVAGPVFGRANWFVVANDDWRYTPQDDAAQRFAHVTAENAGETLYIRCERQTLRRLPDTQAILFTIGIAVQPLGTLSMSAIARIAANVSGLASAPNPGEFERRAAPHYAAPLATWAARRQQMENAA